MTSILKMRQGAVIVAVDGYQVENVKQFNFIRDIDLTKPDMDIIFWDGEMYLAVTFNFGELSDGVLVNSVGRRSLGVRLETYVP